MHAMTMRGIGQREQHPMGLGRCDVIGLSLARPKTATLGQSCVKPRISSRMGSPEKNSAGKSQKLAVQGRSFQGTLEPGRQLALERRDWSNLRNKIHGTGRR